MIARKTSSCRSSSGCNSSMASLDSPDSSWLDVRRKSTRTSVMTLLLSGQEHDLASVLSAMRVQGSAIAYTLYPAGPVRHQYDPVQTSRFIGAEPFRPCANPGHNGTYRCRLRGNARLTDEIHEPHESARYVTVR